MDNNFQDIFQSALFKKTANKFFGNKKVEIIRRPACYFIKVNEKNSRLIKRIIIFPPQGFTANKINLLNPHPETRNARVYIFGKIDPTKKGFKPVREEIKFNFSLTRDIPTEKNTPYATFSENYCGSQLKSWRNWFYVIKETGWGNFHNLINVSDEWVLALLEKELSDVKKINIEIYLGKLSKKEKSSLQTKLNKIIRKGDEIFSDKIFVKEFLKYNPEILVPLLIRMLNIQETGKHEPCTFFALLLKEAKNNKKLVLYEVKKAINLKSAPHYYLSDLKKKLIKQQCLKKFPKKL